MAWWCWLTNVCSTSVALHRSSLSASCILTLPIFVCSALLHAAVLLNRVREVRIRGMGAAVERAVDLAVTVEERGVGAYRLVPATSTVMLYDEYLPLGPVRGTRDDSALWCRHCGRRLSPFFNVVPLFPFRCFGCGRRTMSRSPRREKCRQWKSRSRRLPDRPRSSRKGEACTGEAGLLFR